MAGKYKNDLSSIVAGAIRDRYPNVDLVCKHFFSGAALYANGRICVSLSPVGLAVKLPEKERRSLIATFGAKPLRYFPGAPIKKDYVVLPKNVTKDTRKLRRWIRASIESVLIS